MTNLVWFCAWRRSSILRVNSESGESEPGTGNQQWFGVLRLFQAVLSGAHELRGFHNCDIRESLHGVVRDPAERRRRASAVSRLLKRMHVRGLIARIPRKRRWRVTTRGHSLLGAMIRLHYHGIPLAA